jgi:hypothetical protein
MRKRWEPSYADECILAGFPIEDLAITKAFQVLDRVDSENPRAIAERLESLPSARRPSPTRCLPTNCGHMI